MKRFMKAKAGMLALAALLALPATTLHAQSVYDVMLGLQPNVVRITTVPDDGNPGADDFGFGFIVGEREGRLYIVTAKHVVMQDGPNTRFVAFFHDQANPQEARFEISSPGGGLLGDLAVLSVPVPSRLEWERYSVAPPDSIKAPKPVRFIGRGSEWYLPSVDGGINRVGANRVMALDNLDVQTGTSGAPVISADGIVGMIITDDGATVQALSIIYIEEAIAEWANIPWSLLPLPDAPPETQLNLTSDPEKATVRLNGNELEPTPLETTLLANVSYALTLESAGLVPVTTTLNASEGTMNLSYRLWSVQTDSESSEARLENVQFTLEGSDRSMIQVQYDLISDLDKKYKVTLALLEEGGQPVSAPLGQFQGDRKGIRPGEGLVFFWKPDYSMTKAVVAVQLSVKRQKSRLGYVLGGAGAVGGAIVAALLAGGSKDNGNGTQFPPPPDRPGGQ